MTKKGITDYLGKFWKNFNAPRKSASDAALENFMRENKVRENFQRQPDGSYRRVNNIPTEMFKFKNRKK